MRGVPAVFAVAGGVALAAAVVLRLAAGDPGAAGWTIVGPGPFYAAGLYAVVRRPAERTGSWMLICGALFAIEGVLGGSVLPLIADRSWAWLVVLLRQSAEVGSVVAGTALIGLFPAGRIRRTGERWVLWCVAGIGAGLVVLSAMSWPTLSAGTFRPPLYPVVSPIYVEALAPVGPVAGLASKAFFASTLLGVGMLYLRYRTAPPADRRRVRWLLLGCGSALVLWLALAAVVSAAPAASFAVAVAVLWPLTVVLILGSFLLGVSGDGVLDIDRPARRRLVYRLLWLLIAAVYTIAAAAAGVVASRYLSIGPAVLLATTAALAFQPVRRRLERLADRWVFGARLDGYAVLTRFGAVLESTPAPARLLPDLADAIRQGLDLRWVRVRLDLSTGVAGDDDGGDPELVVPLTYAGTGLGVIECGPRRDGQLLDEDRRLLGHLAGQAATVVHAAHLSTELTERMTVIREQTAELAASRARVAQARDAERRRLQRDLHDGVQQDLVVLSAKVALTRERLRRGDERAGASLAEVQTDLTALLGSLRDFAHAIHPPVLADRGLLEAVEATASRLPLEVVIEADPALRGVRYPPPIEAAGWYVVAEALTNVVKHANAARVVIGLRESGGSLVVRVGDDGRGFDLDAPRGLGLTGLADRVSIVNGTMRVDSDPARGTTVTADLPVRDEEAGDD